MRPRIDAVYMPFERPALRRITSSCSHFLGDACATYSCGVCASGETPESLLSRLGHGTHDCVSSTYFSRAGIILIIRRNDGNPEHCFRSLDELAPEDDEIERLLDGLSGSSTTQLTSRRFDL